MKNHILIDPTKIDLLMEQQFGFGKDKDQEEKDEADDSSTNTTSATSGEIPGASKKAPPQAKPAETEPDSDAEKEPESGGDGGETGITIGDDDTWLIEYLKKYINGEFGEGTYKELAEQLLPVIEGRDTIEVMIENLPDLYTTFGLDPKLDPMERPLNIALKTIFAHLPEFFWTYGIKGNLYGLDYLTTKFRNIFGGNKEIPEWNDYRPDMEGYREWVDTIVDTISSPLATALAANLAWSTHARRKRVALYNAFGSESTFTKQVGAKKMTPLEIKQFIESQKGAFGVNLYDSLFRFGDISEEEIQKEMEDYLQKSKKPFRNKTKSVIIDLLMLGPARRGIYGKIAIISTLLSTDRDIYIDMLDSKIRGTLPDSEIRLLDTEIERLQAANTDGSKSQRDIVFEAINSGNFGKNTSSTQRNALIKAIEATDKQYTTMLLNSIKNGTRKYMTSLSKKIPGATRSLVKNMAEFIDEFKKAYVYSNDPLVQKALQAKKDGIDKVWSGLSRKVGGRMQKVMVSADDILDYQRTSLNMAAADEARFAQAAAQATVGLKNSLNQFGRRLRTILKEEKTASKTNSSILIALKNYAESEQKKLDKEEKQANERFNKAFGAEGKSEEFEEVFKEILQSQVDKIADSEELNSIIDSVFEEIEKEFNTTRQQLSQRLNSIPAAPEDGEQDTQPQTRVDVDGSDDPVVTQGKVPPQSPINETKYTVSKQDLIDVITENLQDQFTLVEVDKDQLINHITEEAYKAISRKK